MSKNEYLLDIITRVLTNLNGDSGDVIPEPENELEKKLYDCVYEFFIAFTKDFKYDIESEKCCIRYAYCKIYAFYNAINCWYCDAYIWEKEANSYFPKITVGAYCLVRKFMRMLEDYRDGRI